MHRNDGVCFTSSSFKIPLPSPSQTLASPLSRARHSLFQLLHSLRNRSLPPATSTHSPLLCCASLSLTAQTYDLVNAPLLCSASLSLSQPNPPDSTQSGSEVPQKGQSTTAGRYDEERVLISEVLVRNKDGEELERKDLEMEALTALKACRANSALTVREVQEDVHRIIDSGYFSSCMPVAVDTRDGIRLVFQVIAMDNIPFESRNWPWKQKFVLKPWNKTVVGEAKWHSAVLETAATAGQWPLVHQTCTYTCLYMVEPNQEFHGLVCEGANVLPSKFLEDAFREGHGKVVNLKRLDEVINSINGWYMERGLFGLVSGVDIFSGGIIRLQVAEAEVNNISIRFLDRKTGEPTKGKTKPETILRQLTTKKGQVYSMLQGKRDVDTVSTMGLMADVSIIPQPAGDADKVDLVMNVVERPSGGFSAGDL
ncbi:hypothetical protein Goarm_008239 [Gossypium armourianum]|uniref:POTRA domain-containing protein n=1 Tax=Gossypium armourianum TaxID=34283 RepID=A0A7J9JPB2_9ROSI|nr:hypothetical protein [Gossypium armourianum]